MGLKFIFGAFVLIISCTWLELPLACTFAYLAEYNHVMLNIALQKFSFFLMWAKDWVHCILYLDY